MLPEPDLITWTEERLGSLFASSDEDFDQTFESIYSKGAAITVNGSMTTREKERDIVLFMRISSIFMRYEFRDMKVEITDTDGPYEVGTVHGTWIITRAVHVQVRAFPSKVVKKIQFTAKIESDPLADGPDKRRIVAFDEVVEEHVLKSRIPRLFIQNDGVMEELKVG